MIIFLVFGVIFGTIVYFSDWKSANSSLLGFVLIGTTGAYVGGMFANFLLYIGELPSSAISLLFILVGALGVILIRSAFWKPRQHMIRGVV